ncbi:hypothetical protein ACGFY0_03685 [Streptomyces chartreusis]|uniref:hypothetical protein n=1 Tax=Streptomyces chartreusis TaxID=1969 RepID=UPI00371EEE77
MTPRSAAALRAFDAAFTREPGALTDAFDAYSAMRAALFDIDGSSIALGDFVRLTRSLGFTRRTDHSAGPRRDQYRELAIRPLYEP